MIQPAQQPRHGVVAAGFGAAEPRVPRAFAGAVHVAQELAIAVAAARARQQALVVTGAGRPEVGAVKPLRHEPIPAPGVPGAAGPPGRTVGLRNRAARHRHQRKQHRQSEYLHGKSPVSSSRMDGQTQTVAESRQLTISARSNLPLGQTGPICENRGLRSADSQIVPAMPWTSVGPVVQDD
jgi:hypothetical protein